jgi:hypothetical protein
LGDTNAILKTIEQYTKDILNSLVTDTEEAVEHGEAIDRTLDTKDRTRTGFLLDRIGRKTGFTLERK